MSRSLLSRLFPQPGRTAHSSGRADPGGIAASGAKSEIDEAIAQAALECALQEMIEAEFHPD